MYLYTIAGTVGCVLHAYVPAACSELAVEGSDNLVCAVSAVHV